MENEKKFVIVEVGTPVFVNENESPSTPGIFGEVGRKNAYLAAYPKVLGNKIDELGVGERTLAEYHLSGSKGTYEIVRTR